MNIYIELWTAKETWLSLPQSEKQVYMKQMESSIPIFLNKGAKIHSWGHNNKANDHTIPYSWYAVWEFPNEDIITEFEALLQGASWYTYFDQINICGENVGPQYIIKQLINL